MIRTVCEPSIGIEQPRLIGELLLSRLLSCERLELYLKYDTVLEPKYLEAMRRGIRRVAGGEPVQYVMGRTAFLGHTLKGGGGGYELDTITRIGRAIENAAQEQKTESIKKHIDALSDYLERVEIVYS